MISDDKVKTKKSLCKIFFQVSFHSVKKIIGKKFGRIKNILLPCTYKPDTTMEIMEMTTEEMIVKHLEDNGQKLSWLAKKLQVSPGHLYSVLKGDDKTKRILTDDNRKKINQVLNTEY